MPRQFVFLRDRAPKLRKNIVRLRQHDHRWPQQGGRQIPRVFPSSGDISTAPSYNDPGLILTGGPPASRRENRGAVSLQDQSPSTALSPLQRTSTEAGFRGGVYGDNIIAQKRSSYVSRDPKEWSHSWSMRKPKTNQQG